MKKALLAAFVCGGLLAFPRAQAQDKTKTDIPEKTAAAKPDVEATIVGMEYEGTKMWLPSPIIAKKGQRVRLTIINNIKSEPNQHGFAIDDFGVKAVVTRGKPETVEFTADKEGIFRMYCQLHPKHVGGQLVVLP